MYESWIIIIIVIIIIIIIIVVVVIIIIIIIIILSTVYRLSLQHAGVSNFWSGQSKIGWGK